MALVLNGDGTMAVGNGDITGLTAGAIESAAIGTGAVLQSVTVFDNTRYVFNSGSSNQITFYDISGLQVSITPKSSTSKFLLLGMVSGGQATNAYNAFFRFNRNGTPIGSGGDTSVKSGSTAMVAFRAADDGAWQGTVPMIFLDSPETSSAIIYKIQICNAGGSSFSSFVNRAATIDTSWQQGSASSLTVLEIAG